MRRLHAMTDLDANAKGGVEAGCISLPSGPTSAGSAAAVLENKSRAIKARMGDKSMVPFSGGIIPLNRFKYGSHSVLSGSAMNWGGFGNHVSTSLTMIAVLYKDRN